MAMVEKNECHGTQVSGKPQMCAALQHNQATSAACVCVLVCVQLVHLGLCVERTFPVIPFKQLMGRGAPIDFLHSLLQSILRYLR